MSFKANEPWAGILGRNANSDARLCSATTPIEVVDDGKMGLACQLVRVGCCFVGLLLDGLIEAIKVCSNIWDRSTN